MLGYFWVTKGHLAQIILGHTVYRKLNPTILDLNDLCTGLQMLHNQKVWQKSSQMVNCLHSTPTYFIFLLHLNGVFL